MRLHGRLLYLAALAFTACGEGPTTGSPTATGWVGSERSSGDTLIVTTESGQVWPDSPRLVEELRIGEFEGAPEYEFGMVTALTVDDEGGIYVFDGHVPALRHYSPTGEYVRRLGSQGAGPGEYEDTCLGLVIDSEGRILMRDPRNGRINVYAPSGDPAATWPVASGLFTSDATILDNRDHLYLRILTGRPERNRPWPIALLHMDDEGAILDTLVPPALPDEPDGMGGMGRFAPTKQWTYSPEGYFVIGISDRYVFELRPPQGRITRISRDAIPAPLVPEERREWQIYYDWMIENRSDSFSLDDVTIPEVKPYFSGFFVDADGRIWVNRYGTAEKLDDPPPSPDGRPTISWRAASRYDVFQPDGKFLGSVQLPTGARLEFARGDQLWGVVSGEFDEPYVVRWRLDFGETVPTESA